ncbi:MAG: V-type ATP synthase subunit F [Candidatus Geothermincolia bacterium]
MERKIAIVGGKTSALGFKAAGLDAYIVAEPGVSAQAWNGIPLEDYGLIFVTEPVYRVLAAEVSGFPPPQEPVVVVIPAVTGSEGLGLSGVKARMEKAVGADVGPYRASDEDIADGE